MTPEQKKEYIEWFLGWVIPPGEEPMGYDDRMTYEDAFECAEKMGAGHADLRADLRAALEKMKQT